MARPMVEVIVFTHNHQEFISDALMSIAAQVAEDFDLVVRLHDDASDDETVRVAKRVLQEQSIRHEIVVADANQYQHGSQFRLDFIAGGRGDYLAFLDGDDFWTSERKLAAQVRVLEKNPEVAICHHLFSSVDSSGRRRPMYPPRALQADFLPGWTLAQENFIGTSTVLLRRKHFPEKWPQGFNAIRGVDDYPIWSVVASGKKIGFIRADMSCYRRHNGQNFATLPESLQKQMLLGALVYIANSVIEGERHLWLRRIERHVLIGAFRSPGELSKTRVLLKLLPGLVKQKISAIRSLGY